MLDCLKNNVNIFYNKKKNNYNVKLNGIISKMHPINFRNFEESMREIDNVINKIEETPNYQLDNFNEFYNEYFEKI